MHPATSSVRHLSPLTRVRTSGGPLPLHEPSPAALPVVLSALGLALVLAVVYLGLPLSGTDLSASEAHRDFAARHPLTPIDLRWYGGIDQFGYSLLSQLVTVALGSRLAGAVSLVVAAPLFAHLLTRTGARRPYLGALAGAACIAANLVSGRIAYALGVAAGLAALDLLLARRPVLAVLAAVLTVAFSPVAGLFLGLVAAGLLLRRELRRSALVLGAVVGVVLLTQSLLFGDGGTNTISGSDTRHAVALLLVVAVCVRAAEVRAVALLTAALTVVLLLVPNPVGLAVMRLPVMFALPVLVAFVSRRLVAAVAVAAVLWYQPPLMTSDWQNRGEDVSQRAYFTPLADQLAALRPTGRVEVVPTRNSWEAAWIAGPDVALARGWLRQADTRWNPLFFSGELTAEAYRAWVLDNAVEYVAVPQTHVSWVGARERDLLETPPPWLQQIWQDPNWRLFRVAEASTIVAAPAQRARLTEAALRFEAPQAGRYEVKVRWSRWLTAGEGVCVRRLGNWTELDVRAPGPVTLTSSLLPATGCS